MGMVTDNASIYAGDSNQGSSKSISETLKSLSPENIIHFLSRFYTVEFNQGVFPGQIPDNKLIATCHTAFGGDYERMKQTYGGMQTISGPQMLGEVKRIISRLEELASWDKKFKEMDIKVNGQLVDLGYLVEKFGEHKKSGPHAQTARLEYILGALKPSGT